MSNYFLFSIVGFTFHKFFGHTPLSSFGLLRKGWAGIIFFVIFQSFLLNYVFSTFIWILFEEFMYEIWSIKCINTL